MSFCELLYKWHFAVDFCAISKCATMYECLHLVMGADSLQCTVVFRYVIVYCFFFIFRYFLIYLRGESHKDISRNIHDKLSI